MINKLYLFLPFLVLSCSIIAPEEYVHVPLNFRCSNNYDPNSPNNAEWKTTCTSGAWIRFYTYSVQPDFSGWVIYQGTPQTDFVSLVSQHLVENQFVALSAIVSAIISYNANGTTTGTVTQETNDHGKTYPTLRIKPKIPEATGSVVIKGFDGYTIRTTQIIIPPLDCFQQGTFVVTAADYLNKAESSISNTITIQ